MTRALCLPRQVIREPDRERAGLERQEKKLVVDIKKMAKSGQMEAVKIMAKDLVRTRNFVKKFILMRANIQAIALKVQTLKSQAAMANAMKGELVIGMFTVSPKCPFNWVTAW